MITPSLYDIDYRGYLEASLLRYHYSPILTLESAIIEYETIFDISVYDETYELVTMRSDPRIRIWQVNLFDPHIQRVRRYFYELSTSSSIPILLPK